MIQRKFGYTIDLMFDLKNLKYNPLISGLNNLKSMDYVINIKKEFRNQCQTSILILELAEIEKNGKRIRTNRIK